MEVPNNLIQVFHVKKLRPGSGALGVEVVADGPTRVLRITDLYERKRGAGRLLSHSANNINSHAGAETSISSIVSGSGTSWDLLDESGQQKMLNMHNAEKLVEREVADYNVCLDKGIGISFVDSSPKELCYFFVQGIRLDASQSSTTMSVEMSISNIQLDNQSVCRPTFPIILSSVSADRGEQDSLPMIHFSVIKSVKGPGRDVSVSMNDETSVVLHECDVIKGLSFLIQELSITIEEKLLFQLLQFARFDVLTQEELEEEDHIQDSADFLSDENLTLDELGERKMYFELLLLQPVKMNLTVLTSSDLSPEMEKLKWRMGLGSLVSIDNAAMMLNALALEHPFATGSTLLNLIRKHYKQEILKQTYKIIGSADFLGNPIGMWNNISTGFKDLFYEPAEGLFNDKKAFSEGLKKGASSFFQNIGYGLSNSASKITGTISKGLADASMDKNFQNERQQRKAIRHKDKLDAIGEGFVGVGKGFLGGITGIVTQPISGANSEGVGGFFKGVGKGMVGVIAKPVSGVFDLASEASAALRDTTRLSRRVSQVRLPRHIGPDGIVIPYSHREALGKDLLIKLNGYNQREFYVSHFNVGANLPLVLVTSERVLVVSITGERNEQSSSLSNPNLRQARRNSSDDGNSKQEISVKWELLFSGIRRTEINAEGVTLLTHRLALGQGVLTENIFEKNAMIYVMTTEINNTQPGRVNEERNVLIPTMNSSVAKTVKEKIDYALDLHLHRLEVVRI
eukprot:Nk52_evm43s1444 gene=Nk52_evmTU43s1444